MNRLRSSNSHSHVQEKIPPIWNTIADVLLIQAAISITLKRVDVIGEMRREIWSSDG